MAGQIIERGKGKHVVRVFLGRDAEMGKRKYLNKTVAGTKKDAQKVLTALLRNKDLGMLTEVTRLTLKDYLEHWLEVAAKPSLTEHTHKEYSSLMRRYVYPDLGTRRLTDLTPTEVQALYTTMLKPGGFNAKGLSPRTVRYTHAVLHKALGQAVKWRMTGQNVAQLVDLPKLRRQEMKALSEAEAGRFLQRRRLTCATPFSLS